MERPIARSPQAWVVVEVAAAWWWWRLAGAGWAGDAVVRTKRKWIIQEAHEQDRNLDGIATHKFLLVFTNNSGSPPPSKPVLFIYIDHAGPIKLGPR